MKQIKKKEKNIMFQNYREIFMVKDRRCMGRKYFRWVNIVVVYCKLLF